MVKKSKGILLSQRPLGRRSARRQTRRPPRSKSVWTRGTRRANDQSVAVHRDREPESRTANGALVEEVRIFSFENRDQVVDLMIVRREHEIRRRPDRPTPVLPVPQTDSPRRREDRSPVRLVESSPCPSRSDGFTGLYAAIERSRQRLLKLPLAKPWNPASRRDAER